MRIKFNSNKSMVIWGIIWCITAAIASEFELSYLFIIPVIYWTFLGSAITDLVVDKDWHGLKRFFNNINDYNSCHCYCFSLLGIVNKTKHNNGYA